jgi:cytosine/adenosine deaminase-related metal-dependent hydrolase
MARSSKTSIDRTGQIYRSLRQTIMEEAAPVGASLRALCACFDMVKRGPATLMNLAQYGIEVGNPADLVVLHCAQEAAAEILPPLLAYKRGQRSFTRAQPVLRRPGEPGMRRGRL